MGIRGARDRPSAPVTNITDEEVKLVEDMIETMYKAPGVGLAAPQVGVSKRIMVTDTTSGEKKSQLITIVNPEIVATEGEQYEEEGCLASLDFALPSCAPRRSFCAALIRREKNCRGRQTT